MGAKVWMVRSRNIHLSLDLSSRTPEDQKASLQKGHLRRRKTEKQCAIAQECIHPAVIPLIIAADCKTIYTLSDVNYKLPKKNFIFQTCDLLNHVIYKGHPQH